MEAFHALIVLKTFIIIGDFCFFPFLDFHHNTLYIDAVLFVIVQPTLHGDRNVRRS
jgi:hypothetical protein